jgi:hypothetical protein
MELNDFRADHTVNFVGKGCNVRFPYRGFVISLAADGSDTIVEYPSGKYFIGCGQIAGTSGESIRVAMFRVDNHLDQEN